MFRYDGSQALKLTDVPNKVAPLYKNKGDYKDLLEEYREEVDELQSMMYAQDKYAMLLVFQAMDAAGKDGTIRHVMSGVNPHGLSVHSFKKPSAKELDHNYMWRTTSVMPERGRIGIFNRSYYEEVLVVRVHPEIVTKYQRIPEEFKNNLDLLWQQRYEDIRNFEQYAWRNGTRIMKFFLNLSNEEQRQRFLARIDTPSKNWKFSDADVKERGYWGDYMRAYENAINATATPHAPWYVVPADDKKNMRLIVTQLILDEMRKMDLAYPKLSDDQRTKLQEARAQLVQQKAP